MSTVLKARRVQKYFSVVFQLYIGNNMNAMLCKDFTLRVIIEMSPELGHVRYINILTWLRGFQVKLLYLVLFSLYSSLFWKFRDKRNLKNLQF